MIRKKLPSKRAARRRRQAPQRPSHQADRARPNRSAARDSHEHETPQHESPYKLYRINRLCELWDIDRATLWRLQKRGVVPPFTVIGGIRGLTEAQIKAVVLP